MLIRCANEQDRLTVSSILIKNNYTVKLEKVKQGGKNVIYGKA